MKNKFDYMFDEHLGHYFKLGKIKVELQIATEILEEVVKAGKTIFTCGNGGSAADSEHIVGELLKSFRIPRPLNSEIQAYLDNISDQNLRKEFTENLEGGIRSISLMGHPAFSSAFGNDRDPDFTIAQKLSVLGKRGDAVILISTSGNSRNIVLTAEIARAMGVKTVSLTGNKDSKLSDICDVTLKMPETEVFKVQEMHLPVYHFLCAYLEERFFA